MEAVISHLVVKEFQIPCAHAPAMRPLPMTLSLCPKSAAEEVCEINKTGMATENCCVCDCINAGLHVFI